MCAKFSPTKSIQRLKSAFYRDFKSAQRERGVSWQAVNVAFGHSPTSSWAYSLRDGEAPLDVQQLPQWIALTGAENVLSCLAGFGGFVLTPLSSPGGELESAAPKAGQESSEAIAAVYAALNDGRVTAEEAGEGMRKIDEGISALLQMRAALAERAESDSANNGRARTLAEALRQT